jgi:hypothetical protein
MKPKPPRKPKRIVVWAVVSGSDAVIDVHVSRRDACIAKRACRGIEPWRFYLVRCEGVIK